MAAPGVGASELLRQSYDQLFARRGDPVPIYFAFRRNGATASEIARGFFQSFLKQYIAYRRVDLNPVQPREHGRDRTQRAWLAPSKCARNVRPVLVGDPMAGGGDPLTGWFNTALLTPGIIHQPLTLLRNVLAVQISLFIQGFRPLPSGPAGLQRRSLPVAVARRKAVLGC